MDKKLNKVPFSITSSPFLGSPQSLGPVISGCKQDGWLLKNKLRLSVALKSWITSRVLKRWEPIRKPLASLLFWTDASLEGWGAHSEDSCSLFGDWSKSPLCGAHINILEIAAVEHLLESDLVPCHFSIKVYTDNKTAFFAINRQGSSKSIEVTEAVGKVRHCAERKDVTIEMVRVPGKFNVLADSLSRGTVAPGEWEIDEEDFKWILESNPLLEVDLFATPFNAKLPKFVCPFDHPRAWAVNAFMTRWEVFKHVYLFPPAGALPRVVSQLEGFPGSAGELGDLFALIFRYFSLKTD